MIWKAEATELYVKRCINADCKSKTDSRDSWYLLMPQWSWLLPLIATLCSLGSSIVIFALDCRSDSNFEQLVESYVRNQLPRDLYRVEMGATRPPHLQNLIVWAAADLQKWVKFLLPKVNSVFLSWFLTLFKSALLTYIEISVISYQECSLVHMLLLWLLSFVELVLRKFTRAS